MRSEKLQILFIREETKRKKISIIFILSQWKQQRLCILKLRLVCCQVGYQLYLATGTWRVRALWNEWIKKPFSTSSLLWQYWVNVTVLFLKDVVSLSQNNSSTKSHQNFLGLLGHQLISTTILKKGSKWLVCPAPLPTQPRSINFSSVFWRLAGTQCVG